MKIKPEQLQSQLRNNLAPVYLVGGEELLLVQESCDLIHKAAEALGFNEHIRLQLDSGFDWQNFYNIAYTSSLFNEKTLLKLTLSGNKIKEDDSKILENYAKNPPSNKILLIVIEKLDAATQKTLWYKALEQIGVVVQIWPINKNLTSWISQRMKQNDITADPEAIKILTGYVENNLLAAAQEIEKLRLIYGNCHLTTEQIIAAIADNARFNIYDLVDNALLGNSCKTLRILKTLKQEKAEPVLILWTLVKELRALSTIIQTLEQSKNIDNALQQHHVWESRKPYFKSALLRKNLKNVYNLIRLCARLDRVIKGAETGNIWSELTQTCANFAA
jgi:DNA polymerase III subunit delta